jgi:hypothetical protein
VFELITITLTGVPELFKGYFAAQRQPHGNTTEPEGARPEAQGMRSKKSLILIKVTIYSVLNNCA